ncbi:hypothetical protein HispidOSU_020412 [Sigmodon hispidus]
MDPLVEWAREGRDEEELLTRMRPSTPKAPQVAIHVERMLAARVTWESWLNPPSKSCLHCLELVPKRLVTSWRYFPDTSPDRSRQKPFKHTASQDSSLYIWSAKGMASHPEETWPNEA